MEKTLEDFCVIGKTYDENSIRELNPLTLAYLGDAVFELLVRTHVLRGNLSANKLYRESIKYVKAKNQRQLLEKILPNLSEEEVKIYKRGRNAKPHTIPKNTEITDYKVATGLEALFGYLYLLEREDRIVKIFMEMIK